MNGNESQYRARFGGIAVVGAALVAGWIASGSLGFMGHALRGSLVLVAATFLCVIGWQWCRGAWRARGLLLGAFFATAVALASGERGSVIFAITLQCCAVAWLADRRGDRDAADAAWAGGCALFAFGFYWLLKGSFPVVWYCAEWLASACTHVAARMPGPDAAFGPTLAGIDLVLASMAWWICFSARRQTGLRQCISGSVIILCAHGLYLVMASVVPGILARSSWHEGTALGDAARTLVPWGLPALGGAAQLGVLMCLAGWVSRGPPVAEAPDARVCRGVLNIRTALGITALLAGGIVGLQLSVPALSQPRGKKIVLYEKGFLNWKTPAHGDYGAYSGGMYGHLPIFLRSLGAEAHVAPEISPEVLADADALVLIYPVDPWTEEQRRCIWEFVRLGGSLLLMAEHTALCDDGGNRFDEILEPTAIRVNFDSAYFHIGGWLESYEILAHPLTDGIGDDRNQFGIVVGASLSIAPPARPLVVGRWGFADRGDRVGEAGMGDTRYNPGERLGDIVLAAEQKFGKGRVIVFGDTSSLCNPIAMGCEPFLSRLFSYLCGGMQGSGVGWRDAAALVFVGATVAFLVIARDGRALAFAALLLGIIPPGLSCMLRGRDEPAPLRGACERPLAFVDASHNNAFSSESWRSDGIMGFALTLSRNGYLPFTLERFDERRLRAADALVMIAPRKPLSEREAGVIEMLVSQGMLLILTAGYEDRRAIAPLLDRLGFGFDDLGGQERGELAAVGRPVPLGFFKSPYLDDGGYLHHVRFHAAWPVRSVFDDVETVARGYWDLPAMMLRRYGKGAVVFVGDSSFVLNRNLENEDGSPIEGMRENAHFWRWFLSREFGGESWVPPRPEGGTGGESAGEEMAP